MSFFHAAMLAGASGNQEPYQIEQSLRFDGTSGKLTRTNPSSSGITNAYKWSYSFWLKHSDVRSAGTIEQPLLSGGNTPGAGRTYCGWGYSSSGRFWIGNYTGADYRPDIRPSDRVWRDPSAWEHFMLVYNTSESTNTDRIKIYSNGVRWEPTGGVGSTISSTQLFYAVNYAEKASNIGFDNILTKYFNGYMAEVHFVDGQALDQYDFGEFDNNGVWRPIEYTGTYGLNGHYLKFDPDATNGVGHDHSGNGNNFTATGFTTSGTGTDVFSDTPTNNFCTWNPLGFRNDNTTYGTNRPLYYEGNLKARLAATTVGQQSVGTIQAESGHYYVEFTINNRGATYSSVGIAANSQKLQAQYKYFANGNASLNGTTVSSYGATWTTGDIIGCRFDLDGGKIEWYKNGTSQGEESTTFVTTYGSHYGPFVGGDNNTQVTLNAGQRAFSYTMPTGASTLCTSNLPASTIKDGSDYFNTVLYTGDDSVGRAITVQDSVGNGWQPDFVWVKARSQNYSHHVYDSVRGASKRLITNGTQAEFDQGSGDGVTAFNSDGFDVSHTSSDVVNQLNTTYVAWSWLAANGTSSNTDGSITSTVSANPSAGFSIVTYTGTGAGATVGHGLGVAPDMFITKNRDTTVGWGVYHKDLGGNTKYLNLNDTAAVNTNANIWNSTSPTSTVFSVGADGTSNGTGEDMVAYCFAEVEGYSKFGGYTGNGNIEGVFNYCGFKPAWLLVRRTNVAADWHLVDSTRSPYNLTTTILLPDLSDAEATYTNGGVDLLSNGFKIRSTGGAFNTSGHSYIFAAFASHPFGGDGVSPNTAR